MSITAFTWMSLFLILAVAAMIRPVWGVCLYFMTFFALPAGWWWGKGFLADLTSRWNLLAALILLLAIATNQGLHRYKISKDARKTFQCLFWYGVNATVVHFLFADNVSRSYNNLILLWKQLGLFLLLYLAIQTPRDLKITLMAIITGAFYVGYEIVINDRGKFVGSRLEGIFIPGAAESNYMAGLMSLCIPLAGGLIFFGKGRYRVFAILASPFIFDVILRCTSRGAYLALLAAGGRLYLATKGPMRKFANYAAILVVVAIALQVKDEDIKERFWSIFVPAEERDASANSRIAYTKAGLRMVADYPLGSGAEAAFKSNRGARYIAGLPFRTGRYRAVHNGYLDIMAGWGIQGFVLYALAIFFAWRGLRRAIVYNLRRGAARISFLGVCIESALISQLVAAAFISSLDGEWFYWLTALMLGYAQLYGEPVEQAPTLGKRREAVVDEPFPEDGVKNSAVPVGVYSTRK